MRTLRLRVVVVAWLALCVAPIGAAETLTFRPPAGECSAPRALSAAERLACYAPAWVIDGSERAYNRIGTPRIRPGWLGGLRVSVDPDTPAVFAEVRDDLLAGRPVQQLVYRAHFEKIPFKLTRYFFEAHRNAGLIAIVTVDAESGAPLLVSTVHSCGCYLAVIPTRSLDATWLPEGWPGEIQKLYGQELPATLPALGAGDRIHIELESGSHRVHGVSVRPDASDAVWRELPLAALATLRALPVEGRAGETASIFYGSGPLRGHVRGAWNPMEGLTVFGFVSLDPTVGMDKDFGDPEQTGTPFYTQLSFWKHDRSRLDRIDRLLRVRGFRLPEAETATASR